MTARRSAILRIALACATLAGGCSAVAPPNVASALTATTLSAPGGMTLTGPSTLRFQSNGTVLVNDVHLKNATGKDWRFPFGFTVMHWDGAGWTTVPCLDPTNTPTSPPDWLCGAFGQSAQTIAAGESIDPRDGRILALSVAPAPVQGFYAFILPLWAGDDIGPQELVVGQPDAAVAFVAEVK